MSPALAYPSWESPLWRRLSRLPVTSPPRAVTIEVSDAPDVGPDYERLTIETAGERAECVRMKWGAYLRLIGPLNVYTWRAAS